MKKGVALLLVLALAGGAGGAYYHFIYKPQNTSAVGRVSSDSEDAVYVTSVASIAGLGSGSGQIQRYAGVVVPQETWSAKLENDRTVKETYVKEGDEVKEGDKLFSYDTDEEQDKLEQAEIDVERLQNDIETYKQQVEELTKAMEKASEADKPTYANQILGEENSIKQTEYEIKSKQLEIENYKQGMTEADVFSKITGIVKSVASNNSDSSSDAYITIMAIGDYRVEGTINEQNINQISEGANIICYSRVDNTQYWTGMVTSIKRDSGSSNADSDYGYSTDSGDSTNSTNYPFYVELDSSDDLMLGQHLYMEINQGQLNQKEGIWIPDYYITTEDDGTSWVWAASDKNTLEKRDIVLGESDDSMLTVEILEGLSAEDYLAVPDPANEEGNPLIFNESGSSEAIYDGYDTYGDGSFDWDDEYYFDDGSFDWSEEDWDWDEEDLDGASFYLEDDWDEEYYEEQNDADYDDFGEVEFDDEDDYSDDEEDE